MGKLQVQVYDFAYDHDDPKFKGDYSRDNLQEEYESEATSNFQERTTSSAENDNPGILGRARALYDFEATNEYELSFSKGDFLILTKRQEEGWLVGYKGDEVGLVPENYIQMIS
ncbi:NAP1-binding protein 2 [Smittium culicis]|uniref:NAP1-binding protein 2 n=1 Tax=Smittium culicis TaxID=133412 RepID=A0A1R1XTB8_9FUNG|nr:NAP1-binding protein 2 [Smittium culicis]